MNKILIWSIIVAFAGFLFGFDTVVISGADKKLQALWGASGQSFGSSVHWILAAIIPSSIPFLFSTIGAGVVFAVFAFMMVLQLLFVIFMMPETKGISLEDLQKKLVKE